MAFIGRLRSAASGDAAEHEGHYWAPLVTVLRRILNGDHTLATPDEFGPAQVAVLDAVCAHLNPPPPPTTIPENP